MRRRPQPRKHHYHSREECGERCMPRDFESVALFAFDASRSIAAWTVLTASFLVPVVVLIIAYPGFG